MVRAPFSEIFWEPSHGSLSNTFLQQGEAIVVERMDTQ
jgi:hypothetical protein